MNGTILIVARNNLALTKAAVRSALSQDVPCDVLVIDNASTDGTGDWLKSKTQVARIIYVSQKSLSACWNAGIKALSNLSYPEILVCNNDVVLRSDTYRMLASCSLPFITCVNVECPDKVGHPGDRDADSLREAAMPHPNFSCFMIKTSIFDRVGPFDEKYYPAYCEDMDYHIRMHKKGISAVCIDLPVLHLGSQTLKTADIGEQSRIRKGAEDNREYFYRKWGVRAGSPEYYKLFQK